MKNPIDVMTGGMVNQAMKQLDKVTDTAIENTVKEVIEMINEEGSFDEEYWKQTKDYRERLEKNLKNRLKKYKEKKR